MTIQLAVFARPGITRTASVGAAAIAMTALVSCSSGATSVPEASTPRTTVNSSGSSSASSPQPALSISESANGTTVTVNRGEEVVVTLHSTYWRFAAVSAPGVLVDVSSQIHGAPPSSAGVPGSGHGAVSQSYQARAAGTAILSASRTTCGEALRCTPAQSTYRVTVVVR